MDWLIGIWTKVIKVIHNKADKKILTAVKLIGSTKSGPPKGNLTMYLKAKLSGSQTRKPRRETILIFPTANGCVGTTGYVRGKYAFTWVHFLHTKTRIDMRYVSNLKPDIWRTDKESCKGRKYSGLSFPLLMVVWVRLGTLEEYMHLHISIYMGTLEENIRQHCRFSIWRILAEFDKYCTVSETSRLV